jgi:hypothetical protein
MDLKKSFFIFLIIFLNSFYRSESIDCQCVAKSHEQQFCDSDFTFKTYVKSVEYGQGFYIRYRVEIVEDYTRKVHQKTVLAQNISIKTIGHNIIDNKTGEMKK